LPHFLQFALDDQIDDTHVAELPELFQRKARACLVPQGAAKLIRKIASAHRQILRMRSGR
jgi:hypothetical protein